MKILDWKCKGQTNVCQDIVGAGNQYGNIHPACVEATYRNGLTRMVNINGMEDLIRE